MDRGDLLVNAAARRFGRAIHDARTERHLSQAILGERASLAQPTISKLERGSLRGMRYATIMRVLAALEVTRVHLEVSPSGWYAELIARHDPEGNTPEPTETGGEHRSFGVRRQSPS